MPLDVGGLGKETGWISKWALHAAALAADAIGRQAIEDGYFAATAAMRAKFADSFVNAAKLAADAVETTKILAKNVTTAKVADAAITQAQQKVKAVVALADAAAILTAAQMIDSGIFTITPTVARALTTDTAANIVAALPDYQVGTWFDIVIVCLAAFAVTLTAGAGITIVGSGVVNNASGTWRARIDAAGAVTIYRM